MTNDLPQGCGDFRNDDLEAPVVSRVDLTFFCTNCGVPSETVSVSWRSHHAMPVGWTCRDVIPSFALPRQGDHIFCCPSDDCRAALDERFPPPESPHWFTSS